MIFVQFIKMLFAILSDKLVVCAGSDFVDSTVLPRIKKVGMPMAMTIPNAGTKMVIKFHETLLATELRCW